MPKSEAQKRADKKYKKRNVKQVVTCFFPNDQPLLDWLNEQPSKAGYIKQIIREDMEKNKGL